MNETIVLPKTIKVGYQNRSDTYTKKLAYIIYIDSKGVLRKETSWNQWRDKNIEANEFENIPTEGFVLNKKAGGYSTGWNHRQTYCRVYDPRGFEFEITIPNLLYILENTNSIKGKGLEGEFVYGWVGKDLVLVPVGSPDYQEILKYNENLTKKVSKKDLVAGKVYLNKSNTKVVYMGYFDEYNTYRHYYTKDDIKSGKYGSKGKRFWFIAFEHVNNLSDIKPYYFNTQSSITNIMMEISDVVPEYSDLMDKLEYSPAYSPYDESQYYYAEIDKSKLSWRRIIKIGNDYISVSLGSSKDEYFLYKEDNDRWYNKTSFDNNKFTSEEELNNYYTFYQHIQVLKNGKIAE